MINFDYYKKLGYCRGIKRRTMSVYVLSTAAHL